MKELDRNKEYITSNLSEERRKELIEYLKEEDLEWETLGADELLDCILKHEENGWHSNYEKWASQDAIDANTLFEEIKLDKNVSYYLRDLSKEQLEEVRLEVIKEEHASVFDSPYMTNDVDYLEWMTTSSGIWGRIKIPKNKVVNALTLFDISDKTEENVLNNGHESNNEVSQLLEEKRNTGMKDLPPFSDWNIPSDYYAFKPNADELGKMYDFFQSRNTQLEDTSFGAGEKTEKQFFYHNSKKHGPNFYTKEEVQFHNGEEWSEDIVVYTQLGSNKKFATTKERFKKFKEVWV